jgi:hypothetical protein
MIHEQRHNKWSVEIIPRPRPRPRDCNVCELRVPSRGNHLRNVVETEFVHIL